MKQFQEPSQKRTWLQWCRDAGVSYRKVRKASTSCSPCTARIASFPALGNDAGAMDKIMGLTLAGAFLDEAPLMPAGIR